MKPRFQIALVVVAFIAGILTHSIWPTAEKAENQSETKQAKRPETPAKTSAIRSPNDRLAAERLLVLEPAGSRTLNLKPEVIDAILSGGRLKRMLSRMGLADDQVEAVSTIQSNGAEELKQIEKKNSEFVSDDRGDYIAISAFPDERDKWLDSLEAALRDLLGDDRAAVIARMIAFADNDEDVGVYRRELFVTETEPTKDGDRLRIEERTFNEHGQHIDSDYELVDARSQSRWGHLLDFGDE
jgi:hypothetical protein